MTENPFYVKLENRGLIKISGPDKLVFLQGLITNDIDLLETQPSLYACLLTPQGKFLHDFFITAQNDEIWLDCEGGERAEDLAKRLTMYKLRANVQIICIPETNIYAVFGQQTGTPEPRHAEMGNRSFEKPALPEKSFETWDQHRIRLTIPDGSRDMIVNVSTLMESNIDKLNGISLTKGCYVGQELTARMHYRGLAKKHLHTVQGDLPSFGAEIREDGKLIGEMRSSSGDIGLALLKDTETHLLKNAIKTI